MANATSKAQSSTVAWGDGNIKRDLTISTATYYPGTMIGINGSGEAVKCTDASGLQFDGIMADSFRIEVLSTDSYGDRRVTVERPFRFTMLIASASAATDVGKAVYALYDNEVAYSGVTHSILVGWVDAVINSTTVLIRPVYAGLRGDASFDGATLTFTGSTGGNTVVVPDNLADGLSIKQGANAYLTFVTTDSGELIYASKKLRAIDNISITLGDADDIALTWDATRLNVTQATTNSEIRWGVDGAGIDQRWYGDTASTNMLWDQSADSLVFTGTAYIVGQKTTCTAKTTDYTVLATDSGKVLTTRGAGGAVNFTLSTVAAGLTGTDVTFFNCVDQDMTLTAQTAGQIMFKNDLAANSVAYSTASEKIGGGFRAVCDGTSWLVMPLAEETQTVTVAT